MEKIIKIKMIITNNSNNNNVINIEKDKKTFVVKTQDGDTFTINQSNDNNDNLNKIENDNKINENKSQFNKDGIEYEINYIDQKWKYKNNYNNKYYKDNYKDKYYYKDYKDNNYKKNKNKKQKQFKNYNIFDDEEKK